MTTRAHREPVDVVVGVLVDDGRRVLITQRPAGKAMAGAWEFPGGKRDGAESPLAALRREFDEELGVDVLAAEPLLQVEHDYEAFRVLLDVWWITEFGGEPMPRESQALRWVDTAELGATALLPADGPIVETICARLAADESARG